MVTHRIRPRTGAVSVPSSPNDPDSRPRSPWSGPRTDRDEDSATDEEDDKCEIPPRIRIDGGSLAPSHKTRPKPHLRKRSRTTMHVPNRTLGHAAHAERTGRVRWPASSRPLHRSGRTTPGRKPRSSSASSTAADHESSSGRRIPGPTTPARSSSPGVQMRRCSGLSPGVSASPAHPPAAAVVAFAPASFP